MGEPIVIPPCVPMPRLGLARNKSLEAVSEVLYQCGLKFDGGDRSGGANHKYRHQPVGHLGFLSLDIFGCVITMAEQWIKRR